MSEKVCFLLGIVFSAAVSVFFLWREWTHRESVERRVDRLYQHLSCGQGILGCDGGPNCPWDHK